MSIKNNVVSVVAGFISAVVITVALPSYIIAYNTANNLEQTLKASKKNSENVLAQYGQKISEAAQVPAMERDNLIKIFTASNKSRYGENGSQADMQWLKEQNPNVSSETYIHIQQIIEAGRNEFRVSQTDLIEVKRVYETQLGSFWTGQWMHLAGYPKINLTDYDIVSTDHASDAFTTHKEKAIIIHKGTTE